jgi:small-conductance mechanosensitive channel
VRWVLAAGLVLSATASLAAGAAATTEPLAAPVKEVVKAETAVASDFERFWRYQLFRAGNAQIEVNQVVLALVIFLVGLALSRLVSKYVRARLLRRNRLHANAAFAVERLLFYFMLGAVVLVSLDAVGIPITALALVGGALAVGIGFGTQDIFNNFISGVILMFEGDIRIGDLIEVNGVIARVEEIGGRCTRVKRADGVDTLVPNSSLLQNTVVNWTLSDYQVRISIVVPVPGTTPAEQVCTLLQQTAAAQPRILRDPPPKVLLNDVGGSVMNYEVFFWIEVHSADDLTAIRSDFRRSADKLLRAPPAPAK